MSMWHNGDGDNDIDGGDDGDSDGDSDGARHLCSMVRVMNIESNTVTKQQQHSNNTVTTQ
jgi:hypothetical protein